MLFDGLPSLARVAVVSVLSYAGLVLILRISGKRSLAKLNAFDLVVTVAFGSTLATIVLSKDIALAEGLLAFAMLAILQYFVSSLSIALPGFRKLVRSLPALLMEDGDYLDEAMKRERVTRREVQAAIRKKGIGRLEDVAAVVLETDGSFSVLRKEGADSLTALDDVSRP